MRVGHISAESITRALPLIAGTFDRRQKGTRGAPLLAEIRCYAGCVAQLFRGPTIKVRAPFFERSVREEPALSGAEGVGTPDDRTGTALPAGGSALPRDEGVRDERINLRNSSGSANLSSPRRCRL
jgi:hypothetical protein